MHWRKLEALAIEIDGSIEILPFCSRPMNVVFASHDLEILLEENLLVLAHETLGRLRVYWLPSIPVISTFMELL